MFNSLKARRAARRLVEAYPEITEAAALDRAHRLLRQHPALSSHHLAVALIDGERIGQMYDRLWEPLV